MTKTAEMTMRSNEGNFPNARAMACMAHHVSVLAQAERELGAALDGLAVPEAERIKDALRMMTTGK